MPIRLLSPEVASQIAAGEVIERPASVVKELVENALDAGAKSISIVIKDAGRTLVEVSDNGCGISADELELSVSRHATSKLSRAEELFHISTLGFRGEALASIGSVSRLTIASRVKEERTGARLRVEAGKAGELERVGAPIGSVVQVEQLFYNVPARLKFLKTDVTERRAIDTFVTRYALAYPHVRFKLTDGEQVSFQTAGDGDRRAILAALYGLESAKQMLEVLAEDEGLKLSGFISPISLTRSNRKEITFFVNGRWVQDIALATALVHAYHTLLMVGRYPLCMLFLEIQPEGVDVNVHPAKAEVRFRQQDKIFSFVQRAARRALLAYGPVPQAAPHLWRSERGVIDPAWGLAHSGDPPTGIFRQDFDKLSPAAQGDASSPAGTSQSGWIGRQLTAGSGLSSVGKIRQAEIGRVPLLRLIGQIGATYLVAEGPDGLYLIDQHAAHERVLFEKLMKQNQGGRTEIRNPENPQTEKQTASQTLLSPVLVNLPPAQSKLLTGQLELLRQIGFEVDEFGSNLFQVRAMPATLGDRDAAIALRAVVEDFEEDETPLQNEEEARLAGRVCKRLAVKAGQVLSHEEQSGLLRDLETCESPRTCPHGRPTMIHLSVEMLERQFGRRGAR